jgi:hypothetical protein
MLNKKDKKELDNATLVSVKKEMAKPRVAKSARAPVRAGEVREPRLGPKEVG